MDMYTWIYENYGLTQTQYEELPQIKKDIIYNNYIIYRTYQYRLYIVH